MLPPDVDARFAVFLRDLVIAWRQQATYPPGHPSRAGGVRTTRTALEDLLALTGPLEVGILPDGLIVHGQSLDSPNALRIAERLAAWHLALLSFQPGCEDDDIAALISRLTDDPRKAAGERFADGLCGAGEGRIRVKPVDFSALSLVEGSGPRPAPAEGPSVWRAMVDQLLAGRILNGDQWSAWVGGGGDAEGVIGRLVEEVCQAKDAARATALGKAVARAWTAAEPAERARSAPQVARILSRLPRGLRGPLIEALARRAAELEPSGGDAANLLRALPTEEAIQALGRLATATAGLPPELALLGQELGLAAGSAPTGASAAELLGELKRRFGDGDLDLSAGDGSEGRPAPELARWNPAFQADDPAFAPLREALAREEPAARLTPATLELLAVEDEPEVIAALLARLERSLAGLVKAASLDRARALVERVLHLAGDARRTARAQTSLASSSERLASRTVIAALVDTLPELPPAGLAEARALIAALGGPAIRTLLEALAEEEGRSRRHHLLSFIVSLGERVVADARAMLRDPRWYVVRNLLGVLRQLDDRGSLAEVRSLARHEDVRVKLEAIRSLFALETEPPTELLAAVIHDPDLKAAEAAVALAGARGFVEAAAPLAELLAPRDLLGRRRQLRVKAFQALGQLGDASVLPALDRYSRRFTLLPVAREEQRAFFKSLAGYPPAARAPYLRRGLRSTDAEIRELCRRLAAEGGG